MVSDHHSSTSYTTPGCSEVDRRLDLPSLSNISSHHGRTLVSPMSRKPPGPMFTNGDYERDWNRQQEEMLPSMYPPLRPADTLNPGPGFPLDAPRILGASSSHRFDNHPPFPSSSSFPEAESPYASTSRHHRHQYQQFQQQQQQQQPLHAKVIRAQYRHSSDSTLQDARPKLEKHAKRTRRHRSISPSGSSNFSSSGSSRSSASDQQLDHSQMAVEAMKQMYGMRNRDVSHNSSALILLCA
jgi:hypothetical protein